MGMGRKLHSPPLFRQAVPGNNGLAAVLQKKIRCIFPFLSSSLNLLKDPYTAGAAGSPRHRKVAVYHIVIVKQFIDILEFSGFKVEV